MASAPPPAAAKKKVPLVVVLLPLIAVLGIAGVVGWNLWKDFQRSEAEDEEARHQLEIAQQEKIRAAKRPVEAVVDAGTPEDDLGNLPPGMRKKPVKPVAPKSPAEKAYVGFKSAYDKLENANESAARKFRAKKLQLDDQYRDGKPANESKFIADCDAAKDKILELLRNPENQ
jgi:hypothetical protein